MPNRQSHHQSEARTVHCCTQQAEPKPQSERFALLRVSHEKRFAGRQSRAATAAALAPKAPPCFSSRMDWVEYVSAAAVAQRADHLPGPLLLVAGEPARFNPAFDVCGECSNQHAAQMARQGRCQPDYLMNLFAAKEPA